jgi:hypothetical protein
MIMYNNNQGFSAPEDMAALFEMYFQYIHIKFQKEKIVNLYAVGVAGIYFPSCGWMLRPLIRPFCV